MLTHLLNANFVVVTPAYS